MSLFWFCLFLALFILEVMTINLVSIWFAIGAVFAFFTSLLVDNFLVELFVFIIVSIITLIITKPFLKRVKTKRGESTNADRIINQKALVVKDIRKYELGEVKVLGNRWTAISDEEFSIGEEVIVDKIEGVKVWVRKIDN